MRKFLIAAAALAAVSVGLVAAPAYAGEGTFQPTVTSSDFMTRGMQSRHTARIAGTAFQYNTNNFGDDQRAASGRPVPVFSGRTPLMAFSYNMGTNG